MTTADARSQVDVTVPRDFNASTEYIDKPVSQGHGARLAVLSGDQSLTYAGLQGSVNQFGTILLSLGIEMEQRVAILLPNVPEFISAFYGIVKVGAVATPVSWAVTQNEQVLLIGDARARALVTTEALWAPLRARQGELPFLRHIILVKGEPQGSDEHRLSDLLTSAGTQPIAAPTTRDDTAFWLHTSGSTGTPKWAMHTHGDPRFSEQLYSRQVIGLQPDDVVFSGSPCFHAYPLGVLTYFAFAAGSRVVLSPERTTASHVFDVIKRDRVTVFAGVPTLYALMLHHAETEEVDVSSLRLCLSAAEALPAEIYRRFYERFGVEILDGIGSTEALHIFISNQRGAARPGSSGQVVPGYEIRLLDEHGAEVAPGQIGSLWVRGGSLFTGYWNRLEATRRVLEGAWYSTGDTYTRDKDGYYWYQGRSDDMLRVSGHWVSPSEVEATLISHPAVLEAAVVGRHDADDLMKPQAFIVLRDGSAASEGMAEDLKEYVKTAMAPYNYPRWIEFVAELPKTATGKVQRFKLRERVSGS
jgi:benzoate-CoA ligase family protein